MEAPPVPEAIQWRQWWQISGKAQPRAVDEVEEEDDDIQETNWNPRFSIAIEIEAVFYNVAVEENCRDCGRN